MAETFWHTRWENNQIGFHQSEVNPILLKHFSKLSLSSGGRIFLPLCGKTLDIGWLLAQGHRVVGIEIVEMAIEQLFSELGLTPTIIQLESIKQYSANNIDIFVGDFFHLTKEILGPVDAIYDRASIVALPEKIRLQYTKHLPAITNHAKQLLVTYEYDQRLMDGPPFSVSREEVNDHYGSLYKIKILESNMLPPRSKDRCPAEENVWLLEKI